MVNTSICPGQSLSYDDKLSSQSIRSYQQTSVLIWRACQAPFFQVSSILSSVLIFLPFRMCPMPSAGTRIFPVPVNSHTLLLPFPLPFSVQNVSYPERPEHGAKTNQLICSVGIGLRHIIQFTTAGCHFWEWCLRYRKGFFGLSDTWLLLGKKILGFVLLH